jgi:ketosteroid isomerase-like protein
MTDANLSAIRTIYEAFGRGEVPAILALLTEDVDWASESSSSAAPWYGPRKRPSEVSCHPNIKKVARGTGLVANGPDVLTMTPSLSRSRPGPTKPG